MGRTRRFPTPKPGLRNCAAGLARHHLPAWSLRQPAPYHGAFERSLCEHLPLVKINPLQARRFAQARGTRAKTDRVDAAVLAQMGAALALQPDAPMRKDHHELKELQIARTALVKDRTLILNRIKTQTLALTKRRSKALLRRIEASLKEIETEIKIRPRATDQGALAHDILCSIPGIAEPTAAAILIACPEIGTLGRKQIASLAGLAQMTRQSGQWHGQAVRRGNAPPGPFLVLLTSRRTKVPARRALYACLGRCQVQPGYDCKIPRHVQAWKTKEGRPDRNNAKAPRTCQRPSQSRAKLGAKTYLIKTGHARN